MNNFDYVAPIRRLIHIALPAIFVSICAVCVVYSCTKKFGVGLTPDSATYLSQSQNLLDSGKLIDYQGQFSSHFPPGYPLVLSTSSTILHLDVRHGAPRMLAAIAYSGSIVGTMLWCWLRGMHPVAMGACVTGIALHPGILQNGILALSDTLFLMLLVLSACCLEAWSLWRRNWILCLAGVLAGYSVLTRYAGVVWPVCCIPAIVIGDLRIRKRITDMITFLGFSYLPLIMWFIVVDFSSSADGARSFAFHPVSWAKILEGIRVLAGALAVTSPLSATIVLFLSLVLCVKVVNSYRSSSSGESIPISKRRLGTRTTLLMYIPAYLAFLCFSISFLDRATPLDERILMSAVWAVVLLGTDIAHSVLRQDDVYYRIFFWMLATVFCVRSISETLPIVASLTEKGYSVASKEILYDETLKVVREVVPAETRIFSNVSWIVWLVCKRPAYQLPSRYDYTSGKEDPNFETALEEICKQVSNGSAIVVLDTEFKDPDLIAPTISDFQKLGKKSSEQEAVGRFLVLTFQE